MQQAYQFRGIEIQIFQSTLLSKQKVARFVNLELGQLANICLREKSPSIESVLSLLVTLLLGNNKTSLSSRRLGWDD